MSKYKYKFELYWNDALNEYRCKAFLNNILFGELYRILGKWIFYSSPDCYQSAKTLRKVAKKLDELNQIAEASNGR